MSSFGPPGTRTRHASQASASFGGIGSSLGLGGVFLHLRAELNFYRLFNEAMEGFSVTKVADRQAKALARAGLRQP